MILNKWNYEKQEYEEYTVPDEWTLGLYETNMEKSINCASCGGLLRFGDSYCSVEINTQLGLGYAVCENCYYEEYKRRMKNIYEND